MRRPRLAGLVLMSALVAVAPASAAAPVVKLSLKGADAVKQIRACGEKSTHHYSYYRAGGRVRFTGRISPAPRRGVSIKLKLKKCVNGRNFNTRKTFTVRAGAGGRFSGGLASPGRGIYWLRAYYGGANSSKEQLRVT